jgi:hypothetical protein
MENRTWLEKNSHWLINFETNLSMHSNLLSEFFLAFSVLYRTAIYFYFAFFLSCFKYRIRFGVWFHKTACLHEDFPKNNVICVLQKTGKYVLLLKNKIIQFGYNVYGLP